MMLSRIVVVLLRVLRHLAPPARYDWFRAMEAEVRFGSTQTNPCWLTGLLATGFMLAATERPIVWSSVLAALCMAIIWWDWHTVDSVRVIAALFLVSALMSGWRPSAYLVPGLVLGSCLLIAHGASEITGWVRPFYRWKALILSDWIVIALVIPTTLLAAIAGASTRPKITFK